MMVATAALALSTWPQNLSPYLRLQVTGVYPERLLGHFIDIYFSFWLPLHSLFKFWRKTTCNKNLHVTKNYELFLRLLYPGLSVVNMKVLMKQFSDKEHWSMWHYKRLCWPADHAHKLDGLWWIVFLTVCIGLNKSPQRVRTYHGFHFNRVFKRSLFQQ